MIYPVGIQSFESLIRDGYVYVDKTAHIYRLATTGRYYFLSRPRRFGKSLLISTMEAYFRGKKELFKGLAMEQLEHEWTEYPVLHLDLNSRKYEQPADLDAELNRHLEMWESLYGDEYKDRALEERFIHVIEGAYQKSNQRLVILVDEYDKPMLQAIGNEDLQDNYRSTLKAFYSVLKTQDRYIRFAFLTGVTKFGKVSVFSDLNNLKDISMLKSSNDICGITEAEIHAYFDDSIKELAVANGMTAEESAAKLKRLYDGYHFSNSETGIYNPFSLLNTLDSLEYNNYWFHTGTPTFLIELLKNSNYPLEKLQKEQVDDELLSGLESMTQNPIPIIYQSGYLTIKGYNERFKTYCLGFPNEEVEQTFVKSLMPFYAPVRPNDTVMYVEQFIRDVERGDAGQFMQRMQAFFADGNYQVAGEMELYFQNCMWVVFKMLGFYTQVERHTSRGRMDVTIETDKYIYILELKLDKSAEEALRQIEEKNYAAPFAMSGKQIFKIGVNFSSETRGIDDYIIR